MDAPGVAGAVLCCALWGGNAVAVKFAVPDIPVFGCAGLRFVIALPLIALICGAFGQPFAVRRAHWWLLSVHTLLTVAQIATFNLGTSLSMAGRASVLINIHPLVVAPLALLLLGERMGVRAWLGLVAAALGVAAMMTERWRGGAAVTGDLIVLLSGLIFGVQTIAQKLTFRLIPPTTLLLLQSALAVPIFFVISGLFEGFDQYHFTQGAIWGILYQGLAVSGLCFSTWMLLLRRYPASQLATLAFMTPLFGLALGNISRGEPLTTALVAGGVLVGAGIILVSTDRVKRRQTPDLILPGEDAL